MLKILAPIAPIVLLALPLVVPATAAAQVVKALVGKYQMEVPGGDILELRLDGTASLAGEETRWSAQGDRLRVGRDVMPYTLQGDRLVMSMGSVQLAWKKLAGAGKGSLPALPKPPAQPPMNTARTAPGMASAPPASATGGNAQDAQARQLLTSAAWCSFTYNKVSGTSTTRKVIFRPSGVMTVNGGAETYSSGYGGTYGGQSNTAGAMRWRLENLRVFVDQGAGAGFQDIGLTATRNSNGSLILHAGGREYSVCN